MDCCIQTGRVLPLDSTRTLWVPKQYNLLLIQGDGDADAFLTIKTANKTIDLNGDWGQREVQLPAGPSTVTFILTRHLGKADSTAVSKRLSYTNFQTPRGLHHLPIFTNIMSTRQMQVDHLKN